MELIGILVVGIVAAALVLIQTWRCRRQDSGGYRPTTTTANRRPPQGGSGTAWPDDLVQCTLKAERERDEARWEVRILQEHFRHAYSLAARMHRLRAEAEMYADCILAQVRNAVGFCPATRRAVHDSIGRALGRLQANH